MRLGNAQIQWTQEDKVWRVATPAGEHLYDMPLKNAYPADMIGVMQFAQHFEKLAYEEGYNTCKQALMAAVTQRNEELINHIKQLEEHNAMLAEKLDTLITKGKTDGDD